MHQNILNFLNESTKSPIENIYYLLDFDSPNPTDIEIASQLKILCTSHIYRNRQSKLHSLLNLKKLGFDPEIIFDIGAQVGTSELYTVYPNAHHIFVEPVLECIPILNQIAKNLKNCTVLNCAVSNTNGETTLSLSDNLQYSSIEVDIGGPKRNIPVRTVDSIYEDLFPAASILLKIDVDGLELNVLQGAKSLFSSECIIVIEATLGDKVPRFNKIVEYLSSYDFKVFDIIDPLFRPRDWNLWQVDLVFIKSNSRYWNNHEYI